MTSLIASEAEAVAVSLARLSQRFMVIVDCPHILADGAECQRPTVVEIGFAPAHTRNLPPVMVSRGDLVRCCPHTQESFVGAELKTLIHRSRDEGLRIVRLAAESLLAEPVVITPVLPRATHGMPGSFLTMQRQITAAAESAGIAEQLTTPNLIGKRPFAGNQHT